MGQHLAAALIAAGSTDAELQHVALAALDSTSSSRPLFEALCANPELASDVAAGIRQHLDGHLPYAPSPALHDCASPELREQLRAERGTWLAAQLCGYPWVELDEAFEIVAAAEPDQICVALYELRSRLGHVTLLTGGEVDPAVTLDALARWFRAGGADDPRWRLLGAELIEATPAMRARGAWFAPPPQGLTDVDSLRDWVRSTPENTAGRVVAEFDAVTHPAADPAVAVAAVESVVDIFGGGSCGEEAAARVAVRALQRFPQHATAVFETLSSGGAVEVDVAGIVAEASGGAEMFAQLITESGSGRLAETGTGAEMFAQLITESGSGHPVPWLTEALDAHPELIWGARVELLAECITDTQANPALTSAVLAALTGRLGELAPAALRLLGAGFSGTLAELTEIIEATATNPGGAPRPSPQGNLA